MKARLGCAFLVCLAIPCWLLAQTGPDNDPVGLQGLVGGPFATSNPDSINLFNGQLTIPIAVGPSYPIGPNLRFQAVLTYNSRVWEFGHPPNQNAPFAYTPITGNPALGIGWNFSLGAVKLCTVASDYCYFGPDGSQHIFDESDSARGTGVFYKSSDGSRLSLKNNGATGFEMWDEAGNHYVFGTDGHVTGYDDPFSNFTHDFGRGRDGWYLTKLEDPFQNNLTVAYYSRSPADGGNPCWNYELTPTPNTLGVNQCPNSTAAPRSWVPQKITVPAVSNTCGRGSSSTQDINIALDANDMISQFTFPAAQCGTATWTVQYGAAPLRKYANPSSGTIDLQTISTINFPSGIGGYTFTYFTDPCASAGLLQTMTSPAGGTIDYRYRPYNFFHTRIVRFGPGCSAVIIPDGQIVAGSNLDSCGGNGPQGPQPSISNVPCDDSAVEAYLDFTTRGVGQRVSTVSGVAAETDYFQYSLPYGEYGTSSTNNCDLLSPPRCGAQSLTVVVYPEVDVNGGTSGRKASRAALFSLGSDGIAGRAEGAPIEERIFDKDVSIPEYPSVSEPVCPAQPFCSNKAIRVTRRTFEYGDDVNQTAGSRRVNSETTYYQATDSSGNCSSCPFHKASYFNFGSATWDGPSSAGNGRHYNYEQHSGSLGNDVRTVTTTWNAQISPSTYLPNLFSERTDCFGSNCTGLYKDQRFEFNTTTGFPIGALIFDPVNHLVWLNCRFKDGQGNVGQEFTKTFASASAPANTYCSDNYGSTMPSVGQDQDMFGRSYSYQNGEILTGLWLNGTSSIGWNLFTLTRDPSTGWVTASADSAGASTGYGYDSVGRTTSVTPAGEAALSISYPSMTQTISQRNGGAGLATYEEYNYDTAGRLVKQRRLMPGSQYSKRFFQYDGRGNPYFTSNWVADSTSETLNRDKNVDCSFSGTIFSTKRPSAAPGVYQLCFDPFGRPQQAVGANFSSLLTVDRTSGSSYYSDVRAAVTVACVNGGLNNDGSCGAGGSNATTTTTLDAFGRATSVVEQPSGDSVSYSYDVNDNLTSVTQGTQTRSFTYDAFGLLRQEATPEKGTVTYDSFGSLGNLRQATEPGSPSLVTLRCYDAAGRVTSVRSNENGQTPACGSPGAGSLYLGFTYDQNASFGKLTQRQSFNPLLSPPTTVTDNFTYGGVGGRVSQQTTTIGSNPFTTQTWLYNSLGLVAQHYHPRVAGSAPFVVSVGYDAGLPVAEYINGIPMITGVGYQPSGMLAGYRTGVYRPPETFGQNVVTTIGQDSVSGQLTSVSAAGGTSSFSTGSYTYDGGSNITGMGLDLFSYDNRSRLTQAYLAGVGTTNCQLFNYDSYGNLWKYQSGSWSLGACSATSTSILCGTGTCTNNRLDSGVVATYDNGSSTGRGNLTTNLLFGSEQYSYDGLNRVLVNQFGPTTTNYVYDGSSERIAKVQSGNWTYTLRDGQGRLTTEMTGGSPSLDNVFLGNRLVASYAPGNTRVWSFYAADHLGTPRLITDLAAGTVETRRHWPYGGDVGTSGSLEKLRFAGMERDLESNHYYDHARNHDFNLSRFLTPDPFPGTPYASLSWNRYGYTLGNPMRFVDPLGLDADNGCDDWDPETKRCKSSASASDDYLKIDPSRYPFWAPTGSGGSGGGGWAEGGSSKAPTLLERLKSTLCSAIPEGRAIGVSQTFGGIGGVTGTAELVINYNTGETSGFLSGGFQIGWNGAVQATAFTSFLYGLGNSNASYSGSFTTVSGGYIFGLQRAASRGTTGRVTATGINVGVSAIAAPTGGVAFTDYTSPLSLGKYGLLLSTPDLALFLARQACK